MDPNSGIPKVADCVTKVGLDQFVRFRDKARVKLILTAPKNLPRLDPKFENLPGNGLCVTKVGSGQFVWFRDKARAKLILTASKIQ